MIHPLVVSHTHTHQQERGVLFYCTLLLLQPATLFEFMLSFFLSVRDTFMLRLHTVILITKPLKNNTTSNIAALVVV